MLKQPCPKCKKPRLLEGPAYDRGRIRCLECGARFKGKKR